ncbi:unnamed protein product [Arabidopsis arenosa]|uniref:Uncharacterized protein n=1 Tax=Arabidopsis arenosa TaxID=38785 RepID=A0A8S2AT14_ARAAE|nr:unnamed protein product [Arabidopsis arenosa]
MASSGQQQDRRRPRNSSSGPPARVIDLSLRRSDPLSQLDPHLLMASESPDVVVVAPVVVNGGAESYNGKDEQLESELSKKLEIAEDGKEDNDEDEGSKGK